ncbi:MAG TPA: glycosyltransferase family 4 protein, partial [Candidatus Thermoplasmatota archaeon]|nr:glycosyltransferase family 4 protein [Candidatus Thermoplasmatota archaeon]
MRVLVVNWKDLSHPRAGGAEVYTEEVARRLARRGHEVELFCASFPGAAPREERGGVRITRAGGRLGVYREAARHLRSAKADVIVDEVNTRPFFAHRHARGTPVVALVHQLAREFWFYETPLPVALAGRFVLEPAWLRALRHLPTVTVSRSTADDLRALGYRDVTVVHNGVDAPPHAPAKDDAPRLAFVGRLTAAKRPLDAVEAFARVRARPARAGRGPRRRRAPAPPAARG